MSNLEAFLQRHVPWVYADGISSLLHGLAVLVPGLFLGLTVHYFLGVAWGMAGGFFYLQRELPDLIRGHNRKDGIPDLAIPVVAAILVVAISLVTGT